MLKKIFTILLATVILCLSGCGKAQESDSEKPYDLQLVEEANNMEELLKKHDSIAYRFTYYCADGTIESSYIYQDKDLYAWEGAWGVLVDNRGDVYMYDEEIQAAGRYLFIGDTYEYFKENVERILGYTYDENEEIVFSEEVGNMLSLSTICHDKELYFGDIEACGYKEEDVKEVFMEYKLEAKTGELLSLAWGFRTEEGKNITISTITRDESGEKYQPDSRLTEAIYGGEQRTVTIITDAGTGEEKVYTQNVSKGSHVITQIGPEYENIYYLDAECTTPVEDVGDFTEDVTFYLKRVEKQQKDY